MECQAEIYKRKILQLAFEMEAHDSFGNICFPDGSSFAYVSLSGLESYPDPDAPILPPFTTEYKYVTAREYK